MNASEINIETIKKLYSLIKKIQSDRNEIISGECKLSGETIRNVTHDFDEGIKQAYFYAGAYDKLDAMIERDNLLQKALELKLGNAAGEIFINIPMQHRLYYGLKLIFAALAVSAKPVIFDENELKVIHHLQGIVKTVKDVNVKKILTEKPVTNIISVFDEVPLSETCYSIINSIRKPEVDAYKGAIVFLQEGIKNKFVKFLEGRLNNLRIAEPSDKNSDVSSKPDAETNAYYKKIISSGEKENCRIIGSDKKQNIKPLIIENILPDSEILNSEYSLPILRIISFTTPNDFLGKINKLKCPYQLNAFSSDYTLSLEMIKSSGCISGKISK